MSGKPRPRQKVYVTCGHGVSLDRRCAKCEIEREEMIKGMEK